MRRSDESAHLADDNLDSDLFVGPAFRAGPDVRRNWDHVDLGTPDEDWIPWVAEQGWLALTRDKRILRNSAQANLMLECGSDLSILTGKGTHNELGELVAAFQPR